jgi:alpha-mannosidase
MRRHVIFAFALCAAFGFVGRPGQAAEGKLVWQVGTCDDDYREFGIAGHYQQYPEQFLNGATFEVGKGDLKKNWCFIQPGPVDAWAGWQGEHPFEVVFNLDEQPQNPFLVTVDLVDVNSAIPPTLRVRVNEKSGSFQLEPGVSDLSLTRPQNGREQIVRMYVAGGFLHPGRNVVNLTITSGSWVLYDCVSLSAVETVPILADRLTLRPTFFFKRRGQALKQIMQASFELYQPQKAIRAELEGEGGLRVEQTFKNVASGFQTLDIEVPPVTAARKAHLRLFVGDEVREADGTIYPQKRWRIYLLPSTHFDLGYNMLQDQALKLHRDNTDRAIDWCARYPGFIWNLEGSYTAQDYLRRGAHPDDFLRLAEQGRLGVQGFYANELTGICSSESLSRLVGYYDFLRHRYGIAAGCAMENDVPTMVATVPMILRGHGIKYLSHGTNSTRTPPGQEMDRYPYYWESPDGSKVLMWKVVGTYAQSAEITGLDDAGHLGLARDRINGLLSEFAGREDYPFDALLLHGAYGDNWPNGVSLAAVPDQWNRIYAYPQLIFTRGPEFFEYIEANFADRIRTVKGGGGVSWEDGAASSARETAETRIAKEQLVTAEKLAALCGPAFQERTRALFARAWSDLVLYDEHTWGADVSISHPFSDKTLDQSAVKQAFADNGARRASKLLDAAADEFFSHLAAREDCLAVFNPSSWARTERVGFAGADGRTYSLLADDVPALGYKLFAIADARPESEKPAAGDTLDNRYYTVRFDPATGAVSSIFDKELGRELVDAASGYGANAYLYALGGEGSSLLDHGGKPPVLDVRTCTHPSFSKLSLPGRQVMRITCDAPFANSFVSEVVLHDDRKRIDFVNRFDKIANLAKEGGYFAFPFAFDHPAIRLEIPDGVMRPDLDQFPGACRDWYAVQHFLTIGDTAATVAWTALDSPLVTLEDINRGQWRQHLAIENGHLFAYVFNNFWWTNYKASQAGPLTFRFALTSGRATGDLAAKQFGEEAQVPLVHRLIAAGRGADADSRSLVEVRGDGVVVQAMMPARFWDGTVIRLREMAGRDATVRLAPRGIVFRRAYLCNLAEDKQRELRVRHGAIEIPCRALALTTVLLER